jgi:hypothetical protein
MKSRKEKQFVSIKQKSITPLLSCYIPAFFVTHLLVAWLISMDMFGQIHVIEMPQPAAFSRIDIGYPVTTTGPCNPTNDQQLEMYERDRQTLQQQNPELYEIIYSESAGMAIHYDLLSAAEYPGADCYKSARKVLDNMVMGKTPVDIKKAVFAVENAYYGNQLSYEDFDKQIKQLVWLLRLKMQQKKISPNDNYAKNMLIFSFITDTFVIKDKSIEKTIIHYPMKYDFEDYRGKNDWSKMFVSRLIRDNAGQCHSLPLLFLILAQELGAEAYLSFSPSHSYIKIRDKKGRWVNIELISGAIISDAGYRQDTSTWMLFETESIWIPWA